MINTINYQKLWVSEFILFLKHLISVCRKHAPAELNIDDRLTPLEKIVNRLDDVFQKRQKSDLTNEIASLDERRDTAIISLTWFIQAYLNYFEETKCQAAMKIKTAVEQYGSSLYKLNYLAETTTLTNLVHDLESDNELAEAVNILGLKPLVDEIKTSNKLFDEKYLERVEEMSKVPDESAVDLRKKATAHYRDLVDIIGAHVLLSGPERYQSLINKLNELIEKYNEMISTHKGTEETEAGEEAEPA